MIKNISVLFLTFILFYLIIGCSSNCDKEMDKVRSKYGAPEEKNTYSSSGYHSETWWYWSKGISYTFSWGENVDGCDKSTYTFDPIPLNKKLSVTQKDSIKRIQKIKLREITNENKTIISP